MLRQILSLLLMAILGLESARGQDQTLEIDTVLAPSSEDRSAPGTEKFVIFGLTDGLASIWEYRPGRPSLEKRVLLHASGWAPGELLRGTGSPNLVRLQIPADRGYRVNLYDIDYRSWKVRRLHAARQIHGLGISGDSLYVRTDQGLRLVHTESSRVVVPSLQFKRLHDLGAKWLVEFVGEKDERKTALFDPGRREVVQAIEMPSFEGSHRRPWIQLSPSGRFLAMLEPIPFNRAPSFGKTKIETTRIHVVDTETREVRRLPIRMIVRGGSGEPILYSSLDIGFDASDRLVYVNATSAATARSLDPAQGSGGMERITVTFSPPSKTSKPIKSNAAADGKSTSPPFHLPAYLRKTDPPIQSRLDLLAEFLERHEIAQFFRRQRDSGFSYRHCPTAFSPDGRRFLGFFEVQGNPRACYYGDFDRDFLVEVDAEGLRIPAIHCVTTPE